MTNETLNLQITTTPEHAYEDGRIVALATLVAALLAESAEPARLVAKVGNLRNGIAPGMETQVQDLLAEGFSDMVNLVNKMARLKTPADPG
jgi:hypothetical protein